jgi:hypothetical protein
MDGGRRLTSRRTVERVGNAGQVDDDGLDTVALALDLGLQAFHLVAVERVGDVPTDVDGGHDCGGGGL